MIEVAEESDAQPMPPLILAKSDGAALYATTDLATNLHQVRADKPAKIVYVVDQRQALHFEQVFRAARRAGMAPGVDADRMVSFEGRTGPYVQYACMRIGSILKRAKTLDMAPGPIVVAEPAERALVLECARFPDVVACASTGLAPNEIAEYVYSLAQAFSRFYLECPVIVAEREPVRASRLAISALSLRVLTQGLFLLGIAVPDRM